MNHISASGHQFFLFLHRFFKVEAVFPHSGHIYFNILYPACVNIFSAWCKKYFFGQSNFAANRNHNFQRKSLFVLVNNFLASSNHFFPIFQKLLSVLIFFWSSRTFVWMKSFIPASGNRHSMQRKLVFKERPSLN